MKNRLVQFLLLLSVMLPVSVIAGNPSDYLILQDIGPYKLDKPEKSLPGEPPAGGPRTYDGPFVVAEYDHFRDHTDTTYEVMYLGGTTGNVSPTVSVTQHSGGEADQWLSHEVDIDFRNYYGIPSKSLDIKQIEGNVIYLHGSAGWNYRWISNDKLIFIDSHDSQMTKAEPLEVVKAYLGKYPSVMHPVRLGVYRTEQTKIWIKAEIDRRLWLADKWAGLIQPEEVDLIKKLENMVDSLEVFLNYRAKYFAVEAKSEIENLQGLAEQNNETAIRAKLTEYKGWWAAHKSEAINLL